MWAPTKKKDTFTSQAKTLLCGNYHSFFFLSLLPYGMAWGILIPQPRTEPGLQKWKHQVLTAGPPGNSPINLLVMLLFIHGNLKTIAFIIFPTYYLMKHSWQLVIYPSFIRENCSESSVTWTKFYNLWQNVNNSWDYVSSGHSSTPQLLTSPNSDRYTNDLIEDRGFFFFNEW